MQRVQNAKEVFPFLSYAPIYEYTFGNLTVSQYRKLKDVWNLRDSDETITKNIEFIVAKYLKRQIA